MHLSQWHLCHLQHMVSKVTLGIIIPVKREIVRRNTHGRLNHYELKGSGGGSGGEDISSSLTFCWLVLSLILHLTAMESGKNQALCPVLRVEWILVDSWQSLPWPHASGHEILVYFPILTQKSHSPPLPYSTACSWKPRISWWWTVFSWG